MITWEEFQNLSKSELKRNIYSVENPNQNEAIHSQMDRSLFVVAGPGSGKTTVIVLKILKLIFVDDISPNTILVTTFTNKAAAELRSRLLGWGDQIKSFINENYPDEYDLNDINLNEIIIGTLDSIAEELLRENREPGNPPPAVIEDFVSNSLMRIYGLFPKAKHENQDLKSYLTKLKGTSYGLDTSEICSCLLDIKDRFFQDQISIEEYRNHQSVTKMICEAIDDYLKVLDDNLFLDFSKLETEFLLKLKDGKLANTLDKLKFVLVDEYQDTNLLQEKIYFELAKIANKNGGSITVVGDDDQSLYRFRGATVDLFNDFEDRLSKQTSIEAHKIDLYKNYRSTENIVNFCNSFVLLDEAFQEARVEDKRDIEFVNDDYANFPILGMFREDRSTLARDLAEFIHEIIYGTGISFKKHDDEFVVKANESEGSAADMVLLCSTPADYNSSGEKERLPLLLRKKLLNLNPPIQTFNPRGQKLENVKEIQILCGLILECIDPSSNIQNSIEKLPREARDNFKIWRRIAKEYLENHDDPNFEVFVQAWQKREPMAKREWDKEVSLISLVYNLITWIPLMQNDVEGLVYLEAVTRSITQTSLFSNFGPKIIYDKKDEDLSNKSVEKAIWNIFVPLATGAIELNEDLLETLPPDRLNIMSIHQAKGLEFPLVIVDVGSDFEKELPVQRFKRFPKKSSKTCNMEDFLRPYCELGKPSRTAIDRSFDDLIRQYFVAYSRPQEVLLLVGLNSVAYNYKLASGRRKEIPNIATGWDRQEEWKWKRLRNIKMLEQKNGTLDSWQTLFNS